MGVELDRYSAGGLDSIDASSWGGTMVEAAGSARRMLTTMTLGLTAIVYGDQLTGIGGMDPSDVAHLSGAARFAALGVVVAGAIESAASGQR